MFTKMVEDAKVQNIITPGSKEETINAVYLPEAPRQVIRFFNFMQTHITLKSNGMGVELRESREGLTKLLKKEGYDYSIYQNFISTYENKLLDQHYKAQEDKKTS